MFQIIQSNSTNRLVAHLATYYKTDERSLFDPFVVIVPAKVLEAWLTQQVACTVGVASLLTAKFWGQYQWQMIAQVLEYHDSITPKTEGEKSLLVPAQAPLSAAVIRWRLFEFLLQKDTKKLANDDHHPLSFLFDDDKDDHAIWQMASELAKVYVGYLTERTDWLDTWTKGERVDVHALIAQKDASALFFGFDEPTPDWQKDDYIALEAALGYLWHELFAKVYKDRVALETLFWQVLKDDPHAKTYLPKRLYVFTVQQLPKIELDFLQQLSVYIDVILLHFNPSMMFWADIVDKSWLQTQMLIKPQSVYLKDHGHGLLSRLGKASRETFAMLAELSGSVMQSDFLLDWQDDFVVHDSKANLLQALQSDILMLEERALPYDHHGFDDDWLKQKDKQANFILQAGDISLTIHSCHSLKRELEVARILIGQWLNAKVGRTLGQVAIMLPEVGDHHSLIASVFGVGVGVDGLSLPATITGVADEAVAELWVGVVGLYRLPEGRFYYSDFCQWLMLPCVYQSFGLSFVLAQRACALLKMAAFVRGLDERHLKRHLHDKDTDYQRTFAYALDRLGLSLAMTGQLSPMLYGESLPVALVAGVTADDAPIIDALCLMYQAFDQLYGQTKTIRPITHWLKKIEEEAIDPYFSAYRGMSSLNGVFDALNATRASLHANELIINLPLGFVLDTLGDAIQNQQIATKTAGNITIGRFGSLRGIGFGFVLLLGMDLHALPRTNPKSGFDLSEAGLPRRGDRVSEDDDNGAFLEAILQASDRVAIFYSGQSVGGEIEKLPAAPVAELVRFISHANCQDETGAPLTPEQIKQRLITTHEALPFVPDRFGGQRLLAPLWQKVAQSLHHQRPPEAVIALPSDEQINALMDALENMDPADVTLPDVLDVGQLAYALGDPAGAYLKGKKPKMVSIDEPDDPLSLDGLQNHKVWQQLQGDPTPLRFGGYLPAGTAGAAYIDKVTDEHERWLANLKRPPKPQPLTPFFVELKIGNSTVKLQAPSPTQTKEWLNIQPTKTTGFDDKLLKAFLCHLCWQYQTDGEGQSLWYYQLKEDKLPPSVGYLQTFDEVEKDVAYELLCRFVLFYAYVKTTPIPLSANNALQILKAGLDDESSDTAWHDALKSHWFAVQSYGKDYAEKDSHAQENWRYILDGKDALTFIKPFLPLATSLYGAFFVAVDKQQ